MRFERFEESPDIAGDGRELGICRPVQRHDGQLCS